MKITDFAPNGYTLYDYQNEFLLEVQNVIDDCDVLVIEADTGSGKSVMLQTIARFLNHRNKWSVATLTPKVQLQDQYDGQFPDTPILKGMGRYMCKEMPKLTCQEKRDEFGGCTGDCVFQKAKIKASESSNAIFNFHSYILNKINKDVIIVDESHSIYGALSELQSLKVWKHVDNYPDNIDTYADALVWIERRVEELRKEVMKLHESMKGKSDEVRGDIILEIRKQKSKLDKFTKTMNGIRIAPTNYFMEHTKEEYRHVMKDQLRLRPTTLDKLPSYIWKDNTKKIILASGTIKDMDIKKFGLGYKRVKYLTMKAPIETKDRPIKCEYVGNMAWKYQDKNILPLYNKIVEIQARHNDTKGIVHMPYNMAMKLKKVDKKKLFIYHDKDNKDKQLKKFLKSPKGTVLIASGMEEGLDLAGPDFGWQGIAKIQYPSRADNLIADWYESDPEWIKWITARTLIQQCGRINRRKGDYGITYIFDSQLGNPEKKRYGFFQRAQYMMPEHFKRRIQW